MSDGLLRAMIAPRSVALIGASATVGKLTARPLGFLQAQGYRGRIYPVNPTRTEILGVRAYPTVSAIPEHVEHAYVMLGAEGAIAALKDCGKAGVRVVSVLADGFAEAGGAGLKRQQELVQIAQDSGILLIGPNSTGVVGVHSGFACTSNAAFRVDAIVPGNIAVLSQSGSLIGTILSRGAARGAAFSNFISVGNEAAVGIGEIGQLLIDDPDTHGFALFMETIRNPDALASFTRAAAKAGKPVVAYMIGRSDEGQALSVSHTGALTGSREAVSAFLQDCGIHQAEHFETLIDAPHALTRCKLPQGRPKAATVVSTTGGGGAMLVDHISHQGVRIAGCSLASRAHLEAQNIPLGLGKLIDVTLAGTKYDVMKEVISTLIADPETGVLVVAIGSSAQFNPELAVQPIIDAVAEAGVDAAPVMAFPLPHAPESLAMLRAGGVPAFQSIEACVETLAFLMQEGRISGSSITPVLPDAVSALIAGMDSRVLDEVKSGAVFEALGIPRPQQIILRDGDAAPDALPFDFPVVAKLISPDLPHKTEARAIRVGLVDKPALECAIAEMKTAAETYTAGYAREGVLIQEMLSGVGEVLVGLTVDPLVGPVVTVGVGGVMTEIYRDTAVRPAPVSVDGARDMLGEIKGMTLLRGFRGKPAGDLGALAQAIAAISTLALHPRIFEAEINPLLVGETGQGVILLDSLIRLKDGTG
jgi:acyl-CoA synthetase (NDP forming)